MTFPRLAALRQAWEQVPPLAVTVQRIARWAGAVPDTPPVRAASADQALEQAMQAGLPVMHARPNDPMLALCGL